MKNKTKKLVNEISNALTMHMNEADDIDFNKLSQIHIVYDGSNALLAEDDGSCEMIILPNGKRIRICHRLA
jgi:hypothetical protein